MQRLREDPENVCSCWRIRGVVVRKVCKISAGRGRMKQLLSGA